MCFQESFLSYTGFSHCFIVVIQMLPILAKCNNYYLFPSNHIILSIACVDVCTACLIIMANSRWLKCIVPVIYGSTVYSFSYAGVV